MTGRDKKLAEAIAAYKKNNYEGISLIPTGVGKGRLMIELCKLIDPKSILYVCSSTELRDKTFIDELHKWDAAYLIPRMDFECYQTTRKWVGKHYDVVLGDEFDACLTPEYVKVFTNNTFGRKILVSATLEDSKRRQAIKIAPIVYEVTLREVIEQKVVNNIQHYFINYDLSERENYEYLEYNKRFKVLLNKPASSYREDQLNKLKISRKQFLSSLTTSANVTKWLLNTLRPRNEKVVVFCGLSKQADRVCVNSYHSVNNDKQAFVDFETGKIKEIAFVDKINRGANITGIKHIVYESIGSTKTKLTQRTGRGLRLDVNDTLNVFYQVPYFRHPFWGKKATVIQDWITASTVDMDISNAKYINYVQK